MNAAQSRSRRATASLGCSTVFSRAVCLLASTACLAVTVQPSLLADDPVVSGKPAAAVAGKSVGVKVVKASDKKAAESEKPAAKKVGAKPKVKKTEAKPEKPKPAIVSVFSDRALEEAVREEVFAKRNTDEPITAEDVAKISRVVGVGKQIRNLEGLQHCKSLMLIDLSNNLIEDLSPIAKLSRLQSVTLAGNQIRSILPLRDLKAMQLLDLSRNQIDQLTGLTSMRNLRTLYVADNQLTTIDPIAGLSKIWSLDVAGNQLTKLDAVSKLSWLTTLEFSDNQIKSLEPITSLTDLDMLIMPGNPIESLAPLVSMCEKDSQDDRRFAPYLDVYLSPDQFSDPSWDADKKALRKMGVDFHEYRRSGK